MPDPVVCRLPRAPAPCHPVVMNASPLQTGTLGAALDRLAETVAVRAGESAQTSYTARLLAKGVPKCAQKLGEEAVELAIAATLGDTDETRKEAADLLYHLAVLLHASGVDPTDVAMELGRREGISGLAEKAARGGDAAR